MPHHDLYRSLWSITIALCLSSAAVVAQSAPVRPSPVLDAATSKRIAQKIITQSARVRPGEFVLLMGGERDLGFLEDMAVAVRQAGAYSLIEYGSPRLARRFYDEVPASMDTLTPQLRLLPILDVV